MNFISKKYLLSALVICASFSNGFTSTDNPYEKYFYNITNSGALSDMQSKLLDESMNKNIKMNIQCLINSGKTRVIFIKK